MHRCEFERKLKKLDYRFNIYTGNAVWGNSAERTSGLYHAGKFVMGIPLDEIPEYTIRGLHGRILRRGWKHAVKNLVDGGYIRLRDAEKVFKCHLTKKLKADDKYEPIQRI